MGRTHRLLFMDDDDDLCVLAGRFASRFGLELEPARNGDEAIAKFSAAADSDAPFDAVILDASIPGGPGAVELVEDFRKITPSVPLIVTSGWSEGDLLSDPQFHGFSEALPKPFYSQQFAEVVARALGLPDGLLPPDAELDGLSLDDSAREKSEY